MTTRWSRSIAPASPAGVSAGRLGQRLSWPRRLWRDRVLLLLALPGLALLVVFHYLPWLGNVVAFEDYQPYFGILDGPWVGLQNFEVITNGDPAFRGALLNTVVITLAGPPSSSWPPCRESTPRCTRRPRSTAPGAGDSSGTSRCPGCAASSCCC